MERIDSKTARAKLKPRREPYWFRLRVGAQVGYRKLAEGEGTWVAKWRDDGGQRRYKALGAIQDEGKRGAFDIARRQAEEWFVALDQGVTPSASTVRQACEAYVEAIRQAGQPKKADETAQRFERLAYVDPLAATALVKLRPHHVEEWRNRMAATPAKVSRRKDPEAEVVTRERSKSTVNREMAGLRAALNRAHELGQVSSDIAWKKALRPLKNADRRRTIYLSRDDRRALLLAASDEVRPFLHGLSLLPLRPGALAALKVTDFHPKLRTLTVGVDKDHNERRITLPKETADFLTEQSKGRLPQAPIFRRADGQAWNKDAWKAPVKDAVIEAGLPQGATAYTMRHSTITDLVTGGLDLLTIAQISGTSVPMIEKHYGHLRQEHAAAALAKLAL